MIEANVDVVADAKASDGGTIESSLLPVLTILICENALLRTGLKHLLSDTCFIVSDAACDDSVSEFPDANPVLLIIGATHCTSETVEALGRLKAQCPVARVCVLADHFDINCVMAACDAGADGFCLTTAGRDVLLRSLELILLGESILPSTILLSVLDQASRRPERQLGHGTSIERAKGSNLIAHKLSVREGEILGDLMEGATNKVIARKLGLTEATVKVHVKAILRKTGAKNRTQAAMWAGDHIATVPSDTSTGGALSSSRERLAGASS
jgi:two-component system, NarL family, nitrate/nitrite response regulator NarL